SMQRSSSMKARVGTYPSNKESPGCPGALSFRLLVGLELQVRHDGDPVNDLQVTDDHDTARKHEASPVRQLGAGVDLTQEQSGGGGHSTANAGRDGVSGRSEEHTS